EAKNTAKELLYRLSDCLRRLDQQAQAQAALQQVKELDGDGQWGTLARARLGDARAFSEQMDDLLNLHMADNEELHVFLELAEQHADKLDEEGRAKCLHYRARCQRGLGQDEKSLALSQELMTRYAKSPWAAEAALYVAEYHYSKGEIAR